MAAVVDDAIALLAGMGKLTLPDEIEPPLFTVYAFQLRIYAALEASRPGHGYLHELMTRYAPDGCSPEGIFESIGVADTGACAEVTAQTKVRCGVNLLAAECIGACTCGYGPVVLHEGNARGPGPDGASALAGALVSAGVPWSSWKILLGPERATLRAVQRVALAPSPA